MLTVDCRVRLVAGGSDWTGRGQEARERLVELMRVDGALRGRQVRVDVHPSRTTWVILGAYATDDGDPEERLMIVRLAGSAVDGLDYYQLPLVRP
jgi:hypothetical protein